MNRIEKEIKKIKDGYEDEVFHFKFKKNLIQLTPVKISQDNIKLITKWRERYWDAFLTKFEVTESNTKLWLENICKDTDRILFSIYVNNKNIGHIGIYKYNKKYQSVNIDSVLKGIQIPEKDLMKKVLDILFMWIFEKMNLKLVQLEVFSDNFKAINLYERAGMITKNSVPIKKIKTKDGWVWRKTKLTKNKIGERYLNLMEITKKDYFEIIQKNR
ncbi:MAG: GNAT family N-acetyltransferase [Nitrosopumilus sp.]|nr:GNAT family N-acetyltransferase [Nitrosopumilus sp.]